MIHIKNKGQILLGVIFRRQIALLRRTVGGPALARVVDPADDVIVTGLFADALEVGGKISADISFRIALTDRVAGHAAARLEKLFAARAIALRLPGPLPVVA